MSSFGAKGLTNKGRVLQAKAQAGAQLVYTKYVLGDAQLGGQSIATLNGVISPKKTVEVTRLRMAPPYESIVGFVLSNQDVTTGFYFRELGLYAMDPDVGEILYWYANAGDTADYIPPPNTGDVISKTMDMYVYVGTASNVTLTIDQNLAYVTHDELAEALEGLDPDIPGASLTQPGIVQLSNATNGTRENVAPTEKALKAVNDEALAAKQLGVEQKANVVAALNSIGVTASTSESWAQLIPKIAAVIRATGNATAADILAGKTASNANGPVTGTIPVLTGNRTATGVAKWPDGALAVYPEKGYQKGGAGDGEIKVTTAQLQGAEPNLNSAYILSGRPIFGVPGGMANRSAENNHMPGLEKTVWAGDRYFIRPPAGYYNGSTWVTAPEPNLRPENFRAGVDVGGMLGTLKTIGPGYDTRLYHDVGPSGVLATAPRIGMGCLISVAGTYRVQFYLKVDDGAIGYGQIYVNGSPRGTLRTVSSSFLQGFQEDITINGDEKIHVYVWTNKSGAYVTIQDFTISTDIKVTTSRS